MNEPPEGLSLHVKVFANEIFFAAVLDAQRFAAEVNNELEWLASELTSGKRALTPPIQTSSRSYFNRKTKKIMTIH